MLAITVCWLSRFAVGQYTAACNVDIPFGKLETLLTVGFELPFFVTLGNINNVNIFKYVRILLLAKYLII